MNESENYFQNINSGWLLFGCQVYISIFCIMVYLVEKTTSCLGWVCAMVYLCNVPLAFQYSITFDRITIFVFIFNKYLFVRSQASIHRLYFSCIKLGTVDSLLRKADFFYS